MPLLAPPQPPLLVAIADDDRKRFWFRRWLVDWIVLTILVTAWFISLGPIPGILALMVAKDILVALLAVGLGLNQQRASEKYTMLQQPHVRDQTLISDTSEGDQEGGRRLQSRS